MQQPIDGRAGDLRLSMDAAERTLGFKGQCQGVASLSPRTSCAQHTTCETTAVPRPSPAANTAKATPPLSSLNGSFRASSDHTGSPSPTNGFAAAVLGWGDPNAQLHTLLAEAVVTTLSSSGPGRQGAAGFLTSPSSPTTSLSSAQTAPTKGPGAGSGGGQQLKSAPSSVRGSDSGVTAARATTQQQGHLGQQAATALEDVGWEMVEKEGAERLQDGDDGDDSSQVFLGEQYPEGYCYPGQEEQLEAGEGEGEVPEVPGEVLEVMLELKMQLQDVDAENAVLRRQLEQQKELMAQMQASLLSTNSVAATPPPTTPPPLQVGAAGQVAGQVTGQPAQLPVGQAAGQAAGQPASQAAGQAASQVASQAAGQPVWQAAGQAAGQLAGQAPATPSQQQLYPSSSNAGASRLAAPAVPPAAPAVHAGSAGEGAQLPSDLLGGAGRAAVLGAAAGARAGSGTTLCSPAPAGPPLPTPPSLLPPPPPYADLVLPPGALEDLAASLSTPAARAPSASASGPPTAATATAAASDPPPAAASALPARDTSAAAPDHPRSTPDHPGASGGPEAARRSCDEGPSCEGLQRALSSGAMQVRGAGLGPAGADLHAPPLLT
ncbi:hypothetical protein QJQ45_023419 [Haematococcus lacustris]|nr:hypothetical protein QJQ45_023419 [Haematococcus lacustris]